MTDSIEVNLSAASEVASWLHDASESVQLMKLVRSGLHHGGATAECDGYYIQGGEEVVAILVGRKSKVYQISTGAGSLVGYNWWEQRSGQANASSQSPLEG